MYPFRVVVFADWSAPGKRVISNGSWSWHCLPGFVALGPGAKIQPGLDVISQKERSGSPEPHDQRYAREERPP